MTGAEVKTATTLRIPPRVMLMGRTYKDAGPLVQLLISEGYMVISELELERALMKMRSAKFGFVLLDIDVFGSAGEKCIGEMRADEQLSALPVLVTSQSGDMAAIERCIAAGADDYLPAEFGPAILRVRVSAALDRRRIQETEYMRREINVARTIQRDFLPETLPEIEGIEIEAALRPARDVSGDFYDCFSLATGEVVLVVGDVCDKGVGAALFMALFRSLIRASADPVAGGATQMISGSGTMVMQAIKSIKAESPAAMLKRVASFTNDYIAKLHGRTNMFATVFIATLEPYSGDLVYVNAGHEPALIIGPDGTIEELRPTGPALGMMPDSPFSAVSRKLGKNHSLLAFTDGLVEAHSPTGEVYGADRLRQVVSEQRGKSAEELVRAVLDALETFGKHSDPHDDVTMLAARLV